MWPTSDAPPRGWHRGACCTALGAVFLLCFLSQINGAPLQSPRTLWAQRRHLLYVTVTIIDLDRTSVKYDISDSMAAVTAATKSGVQYKAVVRFFRRVDARTAVWDVIGNEVMLTVHKFWEWRYWPRLLRDPEDPLKALVQVDWKRWKEEEAGQDPAEEFRIPQGEDEDWWDEELALTKPANFPDDMFDNSLVPHLDAKTLPGHVQRHNVTAVLFFDRRWPGNPMVKALYKTWTMMAPRLAPKGIGVAAVDVRAQKKLASRFRASIAPATKFLFGDGSMFEFDAQTLKSAKMLMAHTEDQLLPACIDIDKLDELKTLLSLQQTRRLALGVFPDLSGANATAFDSVARQYRARVQPFRTYFARMPTVKVKQLVEVNRSGSDPDIAKVLQQLQLERFLNDGGLLPPSVLVVKTRDDTQLFRADGVWRGRDLDRWLSAAILSPMELMTEENIDFFRKRSMPRLYIFFSSTSPANHALLNALRPLANRLFGRIQFLYSTAQNATGVMSLLRCSYHGFPYAVLEDENEYKYCLEATEDNLLTPERVDSLVASYLRREAVPDAVSSEPVPEHNPGPLFKVVSHTLMQTMHQRKDVVLHVYADNNRKWEREKYVLDKVASALEDVESLYMGVMDGFRNEKPPEFPDVGFFPVTVMFPRSRKAAPIAFNATFGFTPWRLTQWIHQEAEVKFDIPDYLRTGDQGEALGQLSRHWEDEPPVQPALSGGGGKGGVRGKDEL